MTASRTIPDSLPDALRDLATPADSDGARAEVRVILVGRTGLEATVRPLGPVRVRTALDAIGELADPLAHGPAAVIIGEDADPGRSGEMHGKEFARALRRVDPGVRILRVARSADDTAPGPYDGVVRSGDTLGSLLQRITAPASSDARPEPGIGTMVDAIDAILETPAPGTGPGDAGLVGLVIRGVDPVGEAVRLIRERLGDAGANFTPAARVQPEGGVEVCGPDGHRFGWLLGGSGANGSGAEAIAPHARWLGSWMALAAQQSQLRLAAFTDPLTGAWNRRYFDRFLEAALKSAQSDRRHLTVLVFDIDDFKKYNDRFGHAAGDSILTETVRLLRSVIRPEDKVCRIGGDEFAVIFHEPDGPRDPTSKPPESIHEIAQRFQKQVCEHKFPKLGEQAPGNLTISGGLATFPWDGRTAEELLARADELALRGKRSGKNSMVLGPGAEGAQLPDGRG